MPSCRDVEASIDAIEAELRRLGYWREEPLPPGMYRFTQAFAMDTMPFPCWLQFVFIPRVRSIIEEKGKFPSGSMVGTHAVRELDGADEAGRLVELLGEFRRAVRVGRHGPKCYSASRKVTRGPAW